MSITNEAILRGFSSGAPSRRNFTHLSGSVATSMATATPEIAELYLRAAAHQLLAELDVNNKSSSGGDSASAVAGAVSAAGGFIGNIPTNQLHNYSDQANSSVSDDNFASGSSATTSLTTSTLKGEYKELLHGIGNAVTACRSHPSAITESGILNVLAALQSYELTQQKPTDFFTMAGVGDGNNLYALPTVHVLTLAHVEYVHACVVGRAYEACRAELGRLAHDANTIWNDSNDTNNDGSNFIWWPRPDSSNGMVVKDVLRYYYLRGSLHLQLHEYDWAKRCFETCLCIPSGSKNSNVVSAIAVAAWKKWVLLQCLMNVHVFEKQEESTSTRSVFLKLPSETSANLKRFLDGANKAGGRKKAQPSAVATAASFASPSYSMASEDGLQPDLDMMPVEDIPNEAVAEPAIAAAQVGDGAAIAYGAAGISRGGSAAAHFGVPAEDSYRCRTYMALARAFEQVDEVAMEATRKNQADFAHDGNLKLASCLQKEFWMRRLILDRARIYSSISLKELSDQVHGSPDQVTHVLQQIAESRTWVVQTVKEGDVDMVYFGKAARNALDPVLARRQQQELEYVSRMIHQLHVSIAATPKYVRAAVQQSDTGGSDVALEETMGPRGVEDL
ncbi:hypothetical protein MPSEU_001029600 [Mayamaea pseudoterrestris]|nr:hypothetical protein MPSEU_001029600 [Mayamaea pseudoterrestris]